MKNKKLFIIILLLISSIIAGTFAYGIWISKGNTNTIKTGSITFKFSENTKGISIENATPTLDEEGIKQKGYDFSLEKSGNYEINIGYYIYLTLDSKNTIDRKYIKAYLTKVVDETEEKVVGPITLDNLVGFNPETINYLEQSNSILLYKDFFDKNSPTTNINYKLRIYLDKNYTEEVDVNNGSINIENKNFTLNLNVLSINDIPKEISK